MAQMRNDHDTMSAFQEEAVVRVAGVLVRNSAQLKDIGGLRPGYGTKAKEVAQEILVNCYPDEDTFDPITAALLRQIKRTLERVAELERREALLTAVVVARRKWIACTRLPEQDELLEALHAADDALTEAGFPWEQPK